MQYDLHCISKVHCRHNLLLHCVIQEKHDIPHHAIWITISCYAADTVLPARLIVIGSCRGPADQARIDALKEKVEALGLQVCTKKFTADCTDNSHPPLLLMTTLISLLPKGLPIPCSIPVAAWKICNQKCLQQTLKGVHGNHIADQSSLPSIKSDRMLWSLLSTSALMSSAAC